MSAATRARAIARPEEIVLAAFALALVGIVAITGKLPQTFAPPLWRVLRRLHVYFVACVATGGALWVARAARADGTGAWRGRAVAPPAPRPRLRAVLWRRRAVRGARPADTACCGPTSSTPR